MGTIAHPSHVLGYWGQSNQIATLQRLLPHYPIRHSDPAQANFWAIAAASPLSADRIALTACGRSQPTDWPGDVWVIVESGRLRLGRDPFGRMTLFWLRLAETIWFASSFKLLLPLIEAPQVSAIALHSFACFSYVPAPLTPIEQIAAAAAGTELIWQTVEQQPQVQSLADRWQESPHLLRHETEAIAQLQGLLRQAIARQVADLPADEPVGVLLSGGIDSSLVTALLVEAGLSVRAYALDFGVADYSELPYAQQVADWLNIPLVRVVATGDRIRRAIDRTAEALDLPYGDGTTAPLLLLKQAAAQEVRVVFNGENGDQLFAGWTNKPLIANGVYGLERPAESFEQQYLRTFQRWFGYESQIFVPELLSQIEGHDLSLYLKDAIDAQRCPSLLARLRRASLMLKGAQNIQPRATALAFSQGLWVRSPFCDPDLTAWTFQLPGELMLQGACEKYILKRAAERWLPPEIVWREKRGMGVPLKYWYQGELWTTIGHWLNPNVLRQEHRWQPHLAEAMLSGQLGMAMRDRYIGNNLWLLILWQAWRTLVLQEHPARRSLDHVFWLPPAIAQPVWNLQRRLP